MTKLKRYLKEHGIQQNEFAEKLGYTEAGISYIVNGKRQGGIALWFAMAEVLQCDVKDIYGKEKDNG